MKTIIAIILISLSIPAAAAERGFTFFPSSVTLNSPLTSTGTITLSNAGIVISTTTDNHGITFQDNTIIKSKDEVFSASTSTIVNSFSTTATTGGECILGSTITLTTSHNARVMFSYTGTFININGAYADNMFSPMIDGAFIPGLSPNHGYTDTFINKNYQFGVSGSYLTPVLSNGPHYFCLSAWTTTQTLSLVSGHILQVSAFEVK